MKLAVVDSAGNIVAEFNGIIVSASQPLDASLIIQPASWIVTLFIVGFVIGKLIRMIEGHWVI